MQVQIMVGRGTDTQVSGLAPFREAYYSSTGLVGCAEG